jgi:hypothetical protein
MADHENPLQAAQPDLHRISQAYRTIAEESEKLSNLPAIDAGNAILVAVQQLSREVREGFASLRVQMRVMYVSSFLNLFIVVC